MDSDYLQQRKNNATLVRNILDEVILDICHNENCFLVANFINIFSFDLIAAGARPKPYYITQKTEKDGKLVGFILEQSSNNSEKNKHHDFEYCIITRPSDIDNQLSTEEKVLHNKNNPVTSDLDVVLIARMPSYKNSAIYFDRKMGYICQSDAQILNAINKKFKQKLLILNNQKIRHNIIQHGALNCCPSIKLEDLNFPMCVYTPKKIKYFIGEKKSFDQNMLSFLNLCRFLGKLGYVLRVHENWIRFC
jgi:hypothetical protein